MNQSDTRNLFRYVAIIGNALYVFWIVYNGIDEGFRGVGTVQAVSLTGLVILLILNISLLYRK